MADKKQERACGCTVQPLPPRSINQTQIHIAILFCPLHSAAPELLAAAKAAFEFLDDGCPTSSIPIRAQLETAIHHAEQGE